MLRKLTACLLALLLLLSCAGCAGGGKTLFRAMGGDTQKWAEDFDRSSPPELTVYIETDSYAEEPVLLRDPATICAVFDALKAVTVSKKTEPDETKTCYIFTFTEKSGEKESFTLREDGCVLIEKAAYEAEGVSAVLDAAYLSPDKAESDAAESASTPEPSAAPDGTSAEQAVFSSPEMNFSFLYDAALLAEKTSGGGAVVYLNAEKQPPYYEVLHVTEGPTAEDYLEQERFQAQMEYGDSLVKDSGAPADLGISGRSVFGVLVAYPDKASGLTLEVSCFAEDLPGGGIAVYRATYPQDNSDSVMAAMKMAVETFQPDANYYTGGRGDAAPTPQPDATPQPQTQGYVLEAYDGGVFTMQLPQGFQIETGGAYAGFSFRAYDPADPDVQIFYYGELGPYFKSEAGKAAYCQLSSDANSQLPVLDPGTIEGCLLGMDSYQQIYNSLSATPFQFAPIHDLSNVTEKPITTFLSNIATSETMLIANLTSTTGAPCIGVFQGTIADAGSYEIDGVDITPSRCAMNVFGVIAPEGKFAAVSESLVQSLGSFRFTEAYIQEGINYTNMIGQNAMEYSRQNMAMMDAFTRDFLDYINDTVTVYVVR